MKCLLICYSVEEAHSLPYMAISYRNEGEEGGHWRVPNGLANNVAAQCHVCAVWRQ